MSMDRRHTAALVERIARVREVQAEQSLSHALARESEQRLLAETSATRLQSTERGLMALVASERLDLPRAVLYQDLASAQQVTLASEQQTLKEREEVRVVHADDLTRKSHYRDRASLRAGEATRAYRLTWERKDAEGLVELWVLRGLRRTSHE
jgi:hypothetical protein